MKRKIVLFLSLIAGLSIFSAQAMMAGNSLAALAEKATSTDAAEARNAITELRAQGPAGLAVLLAAADKVTKTDDNAEWQRLRTAIDAVSAQRDGYASGLYWYTDYDQAL